jgi:SAM-dependent methyltransferase
MILNPKSLRQIRLIELVRALNSLLPVSLLGKQTTGGTGSAPYCYSVWLRHVITAWQAGLCTVPKVVAELGPGDSLGIGLTALVFGAERYYAFDVVEYANIQQNLSVFDEIVSFAKKRQRVPGPEMFPELKPYLEDYGFPCGIFSEEYLIRCLAPERIMRIRKSVEQPENKDSLIHYAVPWSSVSVEQERSIDLIFSQAVLEHVDDLAGAYVAMHRWLKDDGFISHQIDFKCHGTAKEWNGHWTYPELLWKMIRGRRPYLLNRKPYSAHKYLLDLAGFSLVQENTIRNTSKLKLEQLVGQYRAEDINISGAHVLAVKKTAVNEHLIGHSEEETFKSRNA